MALKYKEPQEKLKKTIGKAIIEFWMTHVKAENPLFTFQQMCEYVDQQVNCRPNSPGRILELLKEKGQINYKVMKASFKNRRNSLYKALPLEK